jgi:hypothetical protein
MLTLHNDKEAMQMPEQKSDTSGWEAANARNGRRVKGWTAAWVGTLAVAAFGPRTAFWDFEVLPTLIAVLINIGIGFGMILAVRNQVLGMDELQRKVFLDASAITLGVGMVCGNTYELLEDIQLITFQPEISHLIVVMCLTFLASTVIGNRKYR